MFRQVKYLTPATPSPCQRVSLWHQHVPACESIKVTLKEFDWFKTLDLQTCANQRQHPVVFSSINQSRLKKYGDNPLTLCFDSILDILTLFSTFQILGVLNEKKISILSFFFHEWPSCSLLCVARWSSRICVNLSLSTPSSGFLRSGVVNHQSRGKKGAVAGRFSSLSHCRCGVGGERQCQPRSPLFLSCLCFGSLAC